MSLGHFPEKPLYECHEAARQPRVVALGERKISKEKTLREQRAAALKPRGLRVNDYCALYGVGRTIAYRLINSGKLKSRMIGGRRIIDADSAEELLKGGE